MNHYDPKPKAKNADLNQRRLDRLRRWRKRSARVVAWAFGTAIFIFVLAVVGARDSEPMYAVLLAGWLMSLFCASGGLVVFLIILGLLAFEHTLQRTEHLLDDRAEKAKRDETET